MESQKSKLQELIARNYTIAQIAKEVGKSTATIENWLKKYDLKTNRYINRDPDAKEKVCRSCGATKSIESFPLANIIEGVTYRRNKCDDCYNETKVSRKQRLREWLDDYKRGLVCECCGENDFRVLEFHHNDPSDKEDAVAQMVAQGNSKTRIVNEIKKCKILCANCHRRHHYDGRRLS